MSVHQLGSVALPDDMLWQDEYEWTSVVRTIEYAIDGAMHVHVGQRQAGRPITLAAGDDHGWVDRATVDQVLALASSVPGEQTLTLADGRSFAVCFAAENAVTARPVLAVSDPDAGWQYALTVRLLVR